MRIIEGKLYRITIYCGGVQFIEASNEKELFTYVAKIVKKGSIITSVNEIKADGKTPKVAVLTNKEYKKILNELD